MDDNKCAHPLFHNQFQMIPVLLLFIDRRRRRRKKKTFHVNLIELRLYILYVFFNVLFLIPFSKFYFFCRFCLVGLSFGALYLSKKTIDARRYDDYKARQRMKEANRGEYTPPEKFIKKQAN